MRYICRENISLVLNRTRYCREEKTWTLYIFWWKAFKYVLPFHSTHKEFMDSPLATHLPSSKRTHPDDLPSSKRICTGIRPGSSEPSSPSSTQEYTEQSSQQGTEPHQRRPTIKPPTSIPTSPIPDSSFPKSDEIPAEPHRETAARPVEPIPDVACGADFFRLMEAYRIDVGTPAWMEEALRIYLTKIRLH